MKEENQVFDPSVGFESELPAPVKQEAKSEAEAAVETENAETFVSDENGGSRETEIELLRQLVKLQKKTANRQLVAAIGSVALAVVVAVALIIIVPKALTVLLDLSNTAQQTQELVAQAQTSLKGLDTMIENVDKVVVDNTQALTNAVGNIQNIDTDGLNEAIKNLSDAAEPLAKLNNQVGKLFSNGLFR